MARDKEALIKQGLDLLVSELTEAHRVIKAAERVVHPVTNQVTYALTPEAAMIARGNVWGALMHLDSLKQNLTYLQGSLF